MNLTVVIPCYNEEQVLPETIRQLSPVLAQCQGEALIDTFSILAVDDGSSDATWDIIRTSQQQFPFVHGLKLAHNVGHQYALWAGYEAAAAYSDAVVSIDADLQDDIHAIPRMVSRFVHEGDEIVYGVRKERRTDTFFKRTTALMFYRLMLCMGVDMVYNHADFRLMGRRAITHLLSYPERNIFLRGMVPTIGLRHSVVYYDRSERHAGESKYPLRKMLNFAIDGITSFSVQPLRIITSIGFLIALTAIVASLYAVISYATGHSVPGWTSILLSIWFIGGLQLISIGVIGEYVGKIYREAKRRPRYLIEEMV